MHFQPKKFWPLTKQQKNNLLFRMWLSSDSHLYWAKCANNMIYNNCVKRQATKGKWAAARYPCNKLKCMNELSIRMMLENRMSKQRVGVERLPIESAIKKGTRVLTQFQYFRLLNFHFGPWPMR